MTMKVLLQSPATSLYYALRSNALFSTLSGLSFVVASTYFATLIGIGQGGFLFLGINLLVFAGILLGLSSQLMKERTWTLVAAAFIVVVDILWVFGSLVLAAIPSMATDTGQSMIQGIALIVGLFALWQLTALVKLVLQRRKHRENPTSVASILGIALLVPVLSGCSPADLRTPLLHTAKSDQSLINKGRDLLNRVAESHGLSAWNTFHTQEIILNDVWQAEGFWPAADQQLSLKSILGTFTAQATLLDGPKAGEQFGIQSWRPYHKDTAGTLSFEPAQEDPTAQTFYIPSLQYFNELPFRMLNADLVAYAGERVYRERTYDLLFVTWGSFEPNMLHDQYMLWIDRETHRIAMCQYTLREAGPVFTGTIHFGDYREVQGVFFPFQQTVILPAPEHTLYPLEEYFFHQTRVASVAFDEFEEDLLIVDTSLLPGDVKP